MFQSFKGSRWSYQYRCEKNSLSQWSRVSFDPSRHRHPVFPQWPLQAGCWSGLRAESFTRRCSDYCNICNINSRAGHQHSRPNSHDNEVTVSAQDKMTMMFLSQCVDYALYTMSHGARSCSGLIGDEARAYIMPAFYVTKLNLDLSLLIGAAQKHLERSVALCAATRHPRRYPRLY